MVIKGMFNKVPLKRIFAQLKETILSVLFKGHLYKCPLVYVNIASVH